MQTSADTLCVVRACLPSCLAATSFLIEIRGVGVGAHVCILLRQVDHHSDGDIGRRWWLVIKECTRIPREIEISSLVRGNMAPSVEHHGRMPNIDS